MMRFFEVLNLTDQLDIGEHMISIQTELDDRREYWSILCKHREKFQGEPPSIVVEFIRADLESSWMVSLATVDLVSWFMMASTSTLPSVSGSPADSWASLEAGVVGVTREA